MFICFATDVDVETLRQGQVRCIDLPHHKQFLPGDAIGFGSIVSLHRAYLVFHTLLRGTRYYMWFYLEHFKATGESCRPDIWRYRLDSAKSWTRIRLAIIPIVHSHQMRRFLYLLRCQIRQLSME